MLFLRKSCIILLLGLLPCKASFSQKLFKKHRQSAEASDSLLRPHMLPEFTIRIAGSAYRKNYELTKLYVLKCIPLANLIRDLNAEMDETLGDMSKKKERKKYLKAEREKLFMSFSDIVKDMSLSEGKVFNKLVYRQAGITTYDIIQKYQGGAKAFMWQSLSRLGGANLKLTYDPYYADKVMEDVMKQIDSGKLRMPRVPRNVKEFNNPVYE